MCSCPKTTCPFSSSTFGSWWETCKNSEKSYTIPLFAGLRLFSDGLKALGPRHFYYLSLVLLAGFGTSTVPRETGTLHNDSKSYKPITSKTTKNSVSTMAVCFWGFSYHYQQWNAWRIRISLGTEAILPLFYCIFKKYNFPTTGCC